MTLGFQACAIPAALFAPDDTIAFANDAYRVLMNMTTQERTFSDVLYHAHESGRGPVLSRGPEAWLATASARRRVVQVRAFEAEFLDGSCYMVTESCVEGGWVWEFYTDITVLKSREHMLLAARDTALHDADTDLLTGLHNRRYGVSELDRQIGVAARGRTNLSVVLMDLDHFKSINDTLGHFAGDDVLSHFADEVRLLVRRGDTFARYGGEEFLLLMPDAAEQHALALTGRIGRAIKASAPDKLGHGYTFSAGIARLAPQDDVQTLLRRADTALYAAKAAGRNCARIAEPPSV